MNKKLLQIAGIAVFVGLSTTSAVLANGTDSGKDKDGSVSVGYDKGVYIKTDDGKNKLKINVHLQPQYQTLVMEGQDDVHTFQIRRGQIHFTGNAFSENLTYRVQYEAIGGRTNTTNEGELRADQLLDAYINYKFMDEIEIRAGQFKPYYNREELTSDTKLNFVDRSTLNDVVSLGRDLGLAIHGKVFDKKLEWALYLTNEGNNVNRTNFNSELLMGGRFVYNIMGNHGYEQGDVKDSEDHHLAVAVAGNYNRPSNADQNDMMAMAGDVAYRHRGFSLVGEGHFVRDLDADATVLGFIGQVGYFIVPEKFEVALRGIGVVPTQSAVVNGYEYGGSFNYYFKGHDLKLQADYAMLINSPLVHNTTTGARNFITRGGTGGFIQDQTDHRFRMQATLFF